MDAIGADLAMVQALPRHADPAACARHGSRPTRPAAKPRSWCTCHSPGTERADGGESRSMTWGGESAARGTLAHHATAFISIDTNWWHEAVKSEFGTACSSDGAVLSARGREGRAMPTGPDFPMEIP
ncbi:MAG: hypothetical protein F4X97_17180 [Boseongicola sp. SB0662_bin_57]|nr:hypothetical protein [Boseongicola sp. SB0662_bin_57]